MTFIRESVREVEKRYQCKRDFSLLKMLIFVTVFERLVLRAQTELRVVLRICFRSGRGDGNLSWIFENLTWISSDFDLSYFLFDQKKRKYKKSESPEISLKN